MSYGDFGHEEYKRRFKEEELAHELYWEEQELKEERRREREQKLKPKPKEEKKENAD